MNLHLFVQMSRREDLAAQQNHFERGCFFVPLPEPPPEPFSQLDVTLVAPSGRLDCKAKVIQIAVGAGLALACDDLGALQPTFDTWLAAALEAATDEPTASGWLDPQPSKTADDTQLRADDGVPLHEKLRALTTAEKRRLALEGDRTTRQLLLKDPNKALHTLVLRNRNITIDEVRYLAGYRQADPEALNFISAHREWSKNPHVMLALAINPKTPAPTATRLLRKLPINDIRRIAKAPSTPRAIAIAARKIIAS